MKMMKKKASIRSHPYVFALTSYIVLKNNKYLFWDGKKGLNKLNAAASRENKLHFNDYLWILENTPVTVFDDDSFTLGLQLNYDGMGGNPLPL